VFSNQMN